ncbi:hypothetical protein KIPB_005011 [Kipferlia bialata]|uniref:Copine C-terminal domain-containing protein n=1 Tax=Kipferlia bialata TaxID=797122 RepID=A0A9K3CVE0_9EUKA|nr:hypothetical protein KIPB_005011 [Kipferlia bialata]|eukprot:g5011.t1
MVECNEGVASAYRQLQRDMLEGTVQRGSSSLAPVIDRAISIVQETDRYHVLLILSAGVTCDVDADIAALERATSVPLSVLVVPIGFSVPQGECAFPVLERDIPRRLSRRARHHYMCRPLRWIEDSGSRFVPPRFYYSDHQGLLGSLSEGLCAQHKKMKSRHLINSQ